MYIARVFFPSSLFFPRSNELILKSSKDIAYQMAHTLSVKFIISHISLSIHNSQVEIFFCLNNFFSCCTNLTGRITSSCYRKKKFRFCTYTERYQSDVSTLLRLHYISEMLKRETSQVK